MNTQHIVQLLQQALQELHTQQHAQTPQPMATAPAAAPAAAPAPVIEESRWIEGEVGVHNGSVFDAVKVTNRGENMTGFFMKLEQGGCFVKAFGQDCDRGFSTFLLSPGLLLATPAVTKTAPSHSRYCRDCS